MTKMMKLIIDDDDGDGDDDDDDDDDDDTVMTWRGQLTKQSMKRRMYCADTLMEMHILTLDYDDDDNCDDDDDDKV